MWRATKKNAADNTDNTYCTTDTVNSKQRDCVPCWWHGMVGLTRKMLEARGWKPPTSRAAARAGVRWIHRIHGICTWNPILRLPVSVVSHKQRNDCCLDKLNPPCRGRGTYVVHVRPLLLAGTLNIALLLSPSLALSLGAANLWPMLKVHTNTPIDMSDKGRNTVGSSRRSPRDLASRRNLEIDTQLC